MRKFIAAIGLIVLVQQARAQKIVGGEWSGGVRLGGSSGLSLKHHSGSNNGAFEFIFANSFDNAVDGFTVTGLYEKLANLNGNGQLSALFGGGASMNFKDKFKLGASGIIGFDWRLKAVPITMQVDWMPTWFFVGTGYFSGVNGAFTIRYVLNRRKFERK